MSDNCAFGDVPFWREDEANVRMLSQEFGPPPPTRSTQLRRKQPHLRLRDAKAPGTERLPQYHAGQQPQVRSRTRCEKTAGS